MAGELQISYLAAKTVYVLIRSVTGTIWNGSAFESYATANYANYPITLAQQGTASAYYVGNFPSAITAGTYTTVGIGNFDWNGSAVAKISDMATSGIVAQSLPIRIFRGQMVQNFPFKMVSAADHFTPLYSGVISGQISRDGGSFGALQSGNVTEIGLGWYKVNLTSGDLLANTAALTFAGVGVSGGAADNRDFAIILQRTSGQ
jgi:hypothetical protein